MTHTKGPWNWYGAELLTPGEFVLSTKDAPSRDNARLIAAAPCLLKELQHLVKLLGYMEAGGGLDVPGLATLNGARAAIAKATGESYEP